MFHYSPVVLHGILPNLYYQHYLLLVEGVYLLLKDEVCEADIQQSSRLLMHYCFMFSSLYGTYVCTRIGEGVDQFTQTVFVAIIAVPILCHN